MEFVNHTPFPALAFGGVNATDRAFHVVALRQTLTWGESGALKFADDQAPLCEVDETFDGSLHGCVRQESDLCQYKPRCDVIVNVDAHAPLGPKGQPLGRFEVRLILKRPDTRPPLPPEPDGLNPWMSASPQAMKQWRAEVEKLERQWVPGARLIDKSLQVCGERYFVKDSALLSTVGGTVKLASMGLLSPSRWWLTDPVPQTRVPLRLDRAFGGQCRIDAGSPHGSRVPKAHRLTAEQCARHPDAGRPPVAHDAFAANPWGRGFTSDWFLHATGTDRVAAPQIAYAERPLTLGDFNAARSGRRASDPKLVAGLGVRPKGHPDRARLVGTIDDAFVQSAAPLPRDFDFAVWNAAWPDQQTEFLQGDEVIGLINLCTATTPGAWRDARGNVLLRLVLPAQCPFVLVRYEAGEMAPIRSRLDTLCIEPETLTVSAVYRAIVPADVPIRCLEARQMPLARWQHAEDMRERLQAAANRQLAESEQESTLHGW